MALRSRQAAGIKKRNSFLDTQLNNYWSSTSGVSRADLAWVYQFDKGLNSLHAKTSDMFLRFVRYEK